MPMSQNIKIFKSQNLDRLNELTKSLKKCLREVLCMSYRHFSLFATMSQNAYESKYQNFQITKFRSFKRINKKFKKVPQRGFVYVLQTFFIVCNDMGSVPF